LLILPALQAKHATAPGLLYNPMSHSSHAFCPIWAWYLPCLHGSQNAEAFVVWYWPTAQGTQWSSDVLFVSLLPNLPAVHSAHSELAVVLHVPVVQLPAQVLLVDAASPYKPAAHAMQPIDPDKSWNRPGMQSTQWMLETCVRELF
jgi:hypothetical protein